MTIQKKLIGIQIALYTVTFLLILIASFTMGTTKIFSKQKQKPVRELIIKKVNTWSISSNKKSSLIGYTTAQWKIIDGLYSIIKYHYLLVFVLSGFMLFLSYQFKKIAKEIVNQSSKHESND